MGETLRVFKLQLTKSRGLTGFLGLSIIVALSIRYFITSWIIEFVCYTCIFFLTLFLSMVVTTAMHEGAHTTKLRELGYSAEDFRAYRIGSVSFRIPNAENMTPEESFHVAAAPFLRVADSYRKPRQS